LEPAAAANFSAAMLLLDAALAMSLALSSWIAVTIRPAANRAFDNALRIARALRSDRYILIAAAPLVANALMLDIVAS
jgi:hypothetical protein